MLCFRSKRSRWRPFNLLSSMRSLQSSRHCTAIPTFESILSQWVDDTYVVWVGILNDNDDARHAVYKLKEYVSEKFPRGQRRHAKIHLTSSSMLSDSYCLS